MLIQAMEMAASGTAPRVPQDGSAATYAPRLRREEGLLQWGQDAAAIVNRIRGLSSAPGAYTFLEGKKLKILRARAEIRDTGVAPGTMVIQKQGELKVAAGNGWVYCLELQMENKKRMPVSDFLRGCQVQSATLLTS